MGFRATLPTTKSGDDVKLFVEGNGLQVKVEVNFVFRGTVLLPRSLTTSHRDFLLSFVRAEPECCQHSAMTGRPTLLCLMSIDFVYTFVQC